MRDTAGGGYPPPWLVWASPNAVLVFTASSLTRQLLPLMTVVWQCHFITPALISPRPSTSHPAVPVPSVAKPLLGAGLLLGGSPGRGDPSPLLASWVLALRGRTWGGHLAPCAVPKAALGAGQGNAVGVSSAGVPGRCPGFEPLWGCRGSPGTWAASAQLHPPAWAWAAPASPSMGT